MFSTSVSSVKIDPIFKAQKRPTNMPRWHVGVCACVCGPEGVDAFGGFRDVKEDENARNVGVGAGSLKLDTSSDQSVP